MKVYDARAADALSWSLIAAMLLLFAAVQPVNPILISPPTALLPGLGVLLLIGLRLVGLGSGVPNLVIAADALLQMTLFTFAGILLSYALAAQGGALWDAELAGWDRALGLDWAALRLGLDTSFLAVWGLTIAYHSLIPQMVLVILLLSAAERYAELRVLILAAILAGLATILLSRAVPAMGNLFDPADYRHLPPSVAWLHADLIAGLRSGTLRTIDLRQMMGIVTFPSYHASLALIFIWGFRHVPRGRAAGQAWAGLTIVATPVTGGHYGVDVLAGLALAAGSLAAAGYLARARASSALLIRERPGMARFIASS